MSDSDDDTDTEEVCAILAIAGALVATNAAAESTASTSKKLKPRKKRRWHVRPSFQLREEFGMADQLTVQMEQMDQDLFFQTYRMTVQQFNTVLAYVGPQITKQNTVMRDPIPPRTRLALTLRFLASGDSQFSMSLAFRVGRATASKIIRETCKAIWDALQPIYLRPPTEDDLKIISKDFSDLWQFPNCIGAVDGKHCRIQAPPNSGSEFFCFHEYFSVVLMAVCDARYRFIYVDIGAKGRENDSAVFRQSSFGKALNEGRLPIPAPAKLPFSDALSQHVFVGDEAFPLRSNFMRPYARCQNLSLKEKIYNYRLSRARRVIENAFGIASNRFRALRSCLVGKVETIDEIIKAICVLHNYLMVTNEQEGNRYSFPSYVDREVGGVVIPGQWRKESAAQMLPSIGRVGSNNSTVAATQIRDRLRDYFVAEGAVPWQEEAVKNGRY